MGIHKIAVAVAFMLVAACATLPEESDPIAYGPAPKHAEETIRSYMDATLKDPESVRYRSFSEPRMGNFSRWVGILFAPGGRKYDYGWLVDASINAKNSYGGYVGYHTYEFLFHGERIVDSRDLATD